MRLLIVSHTPHYREGGRVVGFGPTVREIDRMAALFEEVVHLAPLYPAPVPRSSLPYRSHRVRLRLVPPAGGDGLLAKAGVVLRWPQYLGAILRERKGADVVHVRCPANISLLAILLLGLLRHPRPRWVKYAGNWMPSRPEPWSYGLQRWWLRRRCHRGSVTVNGEWPGEPAHVRSFPNPSLSDEELGVAASAAENKRLERRVRLLFVGRLDEEKGSGRAVRILALVRSQGGDAHLDVVGDGPELAGLRGLANELGVSEYVVFHGWKPRDALSELYAKAHFLLLPSESSEGWPKVLSEAMAYGAVPLAGAISSIPQGLLRAGSGRSLPPSDVDAFARAIMDYARDPGRWRAETRAGARLASEFTYSRFLQLVIELFRADWGIHLSPVTELGLAEESHPCTTSGHAS